MRDLRKALLLLVAMALIVLSLGSACVMTSDAHGLTRDPAVAALVAGVGSHQSELRLNLRRLTGEASVTVAGAATLIGTRYAYSGATVRIAQTYVYGRLRAFGLSEVRFQSYGKSSEDRNVIGEIRGTVRPDQIVIIGAHLDDKPDVGRAPGADDNAASCAALLYLAKHLAVRRPARTVRFIFFSGEEVGHLGSSFAARASRRGGENIVAMLNADMIGSNGSGSHVVEVHRRRLDGSTATRRDMSVSTTFVRAIAVYRIPGIRARNVADGLTWSDHTSFWSAGFGAAWVGEERPLSNPVYHTRYDTLGKLSWLYYLSVTKALLATGAHLGRI